MKGRTWVLVLFMLLLVVVAGSMAAVNRYELDHRLTNYIVDRVTRHLGGDFEASSVYLRPGSFGIRDARFRLRDKPLVVRIERIRIEYDLLALLRNRFRFNMGARTVFIEKPRFTWVLNDGSDEDTPFEFTSLPALSLRNLPSLFLTITDGSFEFVRGDSTLVIADRISGWLDSHGTEDIRLTAEGSVLSPEMNTLLRGTVNRSRNSTTLQFETEECDLSKPGLGILMGDINFDAGSADLTLHYKSDNGTVRQTGSYSVNDASFRAGISAIAVQDANATGRITTDEILFDTLTGSVWGADAALSGSLRLRPVPELALTLDADHIDLTSVLEELVPGRDEYPEGIVSISARLDGELMNLAAEISATTDTLAVGAYQLTDIMVEASAVGDTIRCKTVSASYGDRVFTGGGSIINMILPDQDFDSHGTDFDFKFETTPTIDEPTDYRLDLYGTAHPDQERYSADVTLHTLPGNGFLSFEQIDGVLTLTDEMLEYRLNVPGIEITGTAESLFDDPRITADIALKQMSVLALAGKDSNAFLADGAVTVAGTLDSMAVNTSVRITAGNNLNSLLVGSALCTDILDDGRSVVFDGELREHHIRFSQPQTWPVTIVSDIAETEASLTLPDGATITTAVRHDTGELSGTATLDRFHLETIIDIFSRVDFSHSGRITGTVNIGGTINNPYAVSTGPLVVDEMNIGGLTRLRGTTQFYGDRDELLFTDSDVTRKGIHFLHGDGIWTSGSPFVVTSVGRDVRLESIDDLLSGSRSTDGTVNYDLTMSFTRRDGSIDGSATVRNGHFLDIPFDTASGVIGGGSTGFHVSGFTVEKEGVYQGQGNATSGYFWKDATDAPGLRAPLFFVGDITSALPHLTDAIDSATGECQLNLTIDGTWTDPRIRDGELFVTQGRIKPTFLSDELTNVNAALTIDQDIPTLSDFTAVRIKFASGTIQGRKLVVRNLLPSDPGWDSVKNPELLTILNGTTQLDFGVLTGRIDRQDFTDGAIELHIPGFMKPQNTGSFLLTGDDEFPFLVGASDDGEKLTPYVSGTVQVLSSDLTYPLLDTGKNDALGDASILENMFWNVRFIAGSNVNYFQENRVGFGLVAGTTLSRTLAKLEENSTFTIMGRYADDSFRVLGDANSMSGSINYYGTEFDIERAELAMDTAIPARPAVLTARAHTVVYDDTTGTGTDIYMYVDSIDRETGRRSEAPGRVDIRDQNFYERNSYLTFTAEGLGAMQITFTSTNPSDDTQDKIMARLGISSNAIGSAAALAFSAGVDNYYLDSWLRPFEKALRKYTRLDVVRFTPSMLGNIIRSQFGVQDRYGLDNEIMLFDRSRIMLGEYLLDDWFLSYRGQYGAGRDFLRRRDRGFYHEIGLQYILERNTRIQLNYNYDEIINQGDRRLLIRHDFEF